MMLISTELVAYFSRRLLYHSDRIIIESEKIAGYFFKVNIKIFTSKVDRNLCDLNAWTNRE